MLRRLYPKSFLQIPLSTPIPSNIEHVKFCQYAADNIDLIEETFDGMGTFHATQMVVYQRGSSRKQKEISHQAMPNHSRFHQSFISLNVTVPRLPAREDPRFDEDVTENMFIPDHLLTDEAFAKDVSLILSRMYGFEINAVSAWTGFNQVTTLDENDQFSVGHLPLINAPAQ